MELILAAQVVGDWTLSRPKSAEQEAYGPPQQVPKDSGNPRRPVFVEQALALLIVLLEQHTYRICEGYPPSSDLLEQVCFGHGSPERKPGRDLDIGPESLPSNGIPTIQSEITEDVEPDASTDRAEAGMHVQV
jgi:hypothetical protein